MKIKLLLFLLCFLSLNVMGQGVITRQSTRKTEPKKNKTEQPARHNPVKKQTTSKQKQNSIPLSQPSGYVNGHSYVDLGLSVKWATCNVGANRPSDYGGHFAWGETSTKSRYDWDNCFDCENPEKWEENSGWRTYKKGGLTCITPTSGHDTARENWGGTWRMPTDAECEELCNKCKWTWTSKNGHNGYTVTGSNGNSIFIPAAGVRDGTGSFIIGECGLYWCSTLSNSDNGNIMDFQYNFHWMKWDGRYRGNSVRPVTD